MIWNLLFLHFMLFFSGSFPPSEKNLTFTIVHNAKVIGELNTTRTTKDSKTYYQSSTTLETRIIKDIRVHYNYDVIFKNSLLEQSKVLIYVNDKPHAETSTLRKDAAYQIVKNEALEKTIKDSISYATIQLYFKEPVAINLCYSEQDGSFNRIVDLENHTYKKINSKGKENLYYYENGNLKKAVIDIGITTFDILAKPN